MEDNNPLVLAGLVGFVLSLAIGSLIYVAGVKADRDRRAAIARVEAAGLPAEAPKPVVAPVIAPPVVAVAPVVPPKPAEATPAAPPKQSTLEVWGGVPFRQGMTVGQAMILTDVENGVDYMVVWTEHAVTITPRLPKP